MRCHANWISPRGQKGVAHWVSEEPWHCAGYGQAAANVTVSADRRVIMIGAFMPSVRDEAAVDRKRHPKHEARAGAPQPQDSRRDLLGLADPPDRLVLKELRHRVRIDL